MKFNSLDFTEILLAHGNMVRWAIINKDIPTVKAAITYLYSSHNVDNYQSLVDNSDLYGAAPFLCS